MTDAHETGEGKRNINRVMDRDDDQDGNQFGRALNQEFEDVLGNRSGDFLKFVRMILDI